MLPNRCFFSDHHPATPPTPSLVPTYDLPLQQKLVDAALFPSYGLANLLQPKQPNHIGEALLPFFGMLLNRMEPQAHYFPDPGMPLLHAAHGGPFHRRTNRGGVASIPSSGPVRPWTSPMNHREPARMEPHARYFPDPGMPLLHTAHEGPSHRRTNCGGVASIPWSGPVRPRTSPMNHREPARMEPHARYFTDPGMPLLHAAHEGPSHRRTNRGGVASIPLSGPVRPRTSPMNHREPDRMEPQARYFPDPGMPLLHAAHEGSVQPLVWTGTAPDLPYEPPRTGLDGTTGSLLSGSRNASPTPSPRRSFS
jgi:hypothetical protein